MIALIIIAVFVLWFLFVNVMWMKRYIDVVPAYIWAMFMVFGAVAIIYDVVFNFTVGAVIFLRFASFDELTFTARLQEILAYENPNTWRWKLARLICRYLIEPWDEGHCD